MPTRRDFIGQTTGTLGALALVPGSTLAMRLEAQLVLAEQLETEPPGSAPRELAQDERFWKRVRRSYVLSSEVVNLDHGWTNPAPRAAVEELVRQARALEALPAEHLGRLFFDIKPGAVRTALAETLGVAASEIALVRNATEALDTVLLGVPLSAGDEIVCSAHDYFAMLDALEQRRARDGVVLRMLRPPVPAPSMDALAKLYESAIGARTRLVLLTHPSNLTGQLLPVPRIAAAAHAVGAEVVVDGAQSLGLLEEPVTSLGCDYYGASCHKWLGTPVGLGVLWMRPEHVAKVWPLVPPPPRQTGMRRFEWIGTAPDYVAPAALPALALHDALGPARKAARLRYLSTYWRTRSAAALPQARFFSVAEEAMSCGLCTMQLPGMDHEMLQQRLRQRDRILVQEVGGPPRNPDLQGLRVTPNVYTTSEELDRLVAALVAATSGIP